MIRVSVTEAEIAAHVAEARVRRTSKFPRCDCKGNKRLELKWKQDAKDDVCGFIKGQYGKTPDKLDATDRRALLRDCRKFLPKDKIAKLTSSSTGRKGHLFWAEFCESTHKTEELAPADVLKIMRRMFPKYANAKKLTDIVLTDVQKSRLRANILLFSKFDDNTKEQLGLFKLGRGAAKKKFSPGMTTLEAEELMMKIINASKTGVKFHRSPETGYLIGEAKSSSLVRAAWRRMAQNHAADLPLSFLEKYADKLMKNKPGRKKSLRGATPDSTPKVSRKKKVKKIKPIKHVAPKVKKSDSTVDIEDDLNTKSDVEMQQINSAKPQKIIADKEALRMFINNILKRSDPSYPLSMQIRDWSNPEWSLVDAYRTSIDKALLEQYQDKIDQARRVLGIKSGGAYASIRDNRQLAVAHVITSWMCGDL